MTESSVTESVLHGHLQSGTSLSEPKPVPMKHGTAKHKARTRALVLSEMSASGRRISAAAPCA